MARNKLQPVELGKLRGFCRKCGLPIVKKDRNCPRCSSATTRLSETAPPESKLYITQSLDSLVFGEFKLRHGV